MSSWDRCPDPETLAAFVDRSLPAHEAASVLAHSEGCPRCRHTVSHVVRAFASSASSVPSVRVRKPAFERGQAIGRYLIDCCIGAGSMGEVYAADDPELGRRVAIKIVRLEPGSEGELRDARRVQREARAMASLSHPNIVTIFDVGTHDDTIFLAMELVEGLSLRQWCARQPRSIGERIDVFRRAGLGLAAAHDRGIVHRDFKPDNVLVGEDGSVRVTDFGLARFDRDVHRNRTDDSTVEHAEAPTTRGDIGTPAYMAPEQIRGEPATPRSDQFAFCIALYEALHDGQRPFSDTDARRRLAAMEVGPPAFARGLPPQVRSVLERGLRFEPSERFASMDALLHALAPRSRPRWIFAAIAVATLGVSWSVARSGPSPCEPITSPLQGVWDADRRDRLTTALHDIDLPWARDGARDLVERLDAYGAAWLHQRTAACRATLERKEQSVTVMEAQLGCLRRARASFSATVDALTVPTPEVLSRAPQMLDALPSLAACLEPDDLDSPPPSDQRLALEALVAQADARFAAGQYHHALGMAASTKIAAVATDSLILHLDAATVEGAALAQLGFHAAGAVVLEAALHEALAAERSAAAGRLATRLACGMGPDERHRRAALAYGRVALALLERSRLPAEFARAQLCVASAHDDLGEPAVSERLHRELLRRRSGQDLDPVIDAKIRHSLGVTLAAMGRLGEGVVEQRAALEITERRLGPDHPGSLIIAAALAHTLLQLDAFDEAERHLQRAIEVWSGLAGACSPRVSAFRNVLAIAYARRGDHARAEPVLQRALACTSDDDPTVVSIVAHLADAAEARGDLATASRLIADAVARGERLLPPEHPILVRARWQRGRLAANRGDEALARELLEQAWAVASASPSVAPDQRALVAETLAPLRWRARDRAGAIEVAETGIRSLPATPTDEHRQIVERLRRWLAVTTKPTVAQR